ncbi:cupin domain-containing protein [Kutzneria buriramensis]|nr:cupin domain-containing protein [Kutzneria buriramensis]
MVMGEVDFRRAEHENLTSAYGLHLRLLQPWAGLDAPFRGAWCLLRPGDASDPHSHHEHEIMIGIAGHGELVGNGRRDPFGAGDIVRLTAGVEHQLVNEGEQDFTYYAIWWDHAMSEEFLGRRP